MLFFNGVTRMRDVTDGTSNTIIIAEQSGAVGGKDLRANYQGGWSGFYNGSQRPSQVTASDPFPCGVTTLRYAINLNASSAPNGASTAYSYNTVINSFHTGGTHALMADGSVHFLSENMNLNTLYYLGAKSDGQVVGEF